MRSAARMASAAAVLLAGVSVALIFRKSGPPTPPPAIPFEPLVRHETTFGPNLNDTPSTTPLLATQQPATPSVEPQPSPAPVAPLTDVWSQPDHAPPRIASEYPGKGGLLDQHQIAMTLHRPATQEVDATTPREHQIVDGDTLAALAQRYLGDAQLASKLFESNRDLLTDPELLPIGVRIRIPPQ